ncbi:MAG: bis(5'-nucleosyl)-tetraphosphatase (symmetrical) YqeK [Lachnospiraceae bacterium]|nr:bis(5'-nucleosyl)-tetraphosphatase (symmetrical) YqeK [Lachnospiraceae bacterium]
MDYIEKKKEVETKLKDILSERRYMHTVGVVDTASEMAEIYGYDADKAKLAAVLHDLAKDYSSVAQLRKCKEAGIELSAVEEANTELIHAKLGAVLAKTEYGIDDDEICEAIKWHTTGKPDMKLLEKIIFVADYIEPGRDKAPNLDAIRKIARKDIDDAVYYIMRDTLYYLYMTQPYAVDEMTKKAFEYYKAIFKTKHDKEEI